MKLWLLAAQNSRADSIALLMRKVRWRIWWSDVRYVGEFELTEREDRPGQWIIRVEHCGPGEPITWMEYVRLGVYTLWDWRTVHEVADQLLLAEHCFRRVVGRRE